ncbi:MAG: spermidine synthase [SAR202 cluster bacterium]|nr:spermidine synthase [SAR202 cluster bacterium]
MEILGKWYFELIAPDQQLIYRIKNSIYSGVTQYQGVEILETSTLGRSLVLDNKTQSTEADEFVYHEALVHPAMLLHARGPRSVFIGGGGEGATLRDVLAHKSVQRVVMVDLDKEVVGLCKKYLPGHHQGAFDDPRVELRHEDARQYLAGTTEKFDAFILDLVDPLEGGPAYKLYTTEFYNIVKSKMNPGAILVTQSGPAGITFFRQTFSPIHRTLSAVFPKVQAYTIYMASFVALWSFNLAYTQPPAQDPSPEQIDALIPQRIKKPMKFYDGISHRHMFSLPLYLRRGLAAETRVATDDNPAYMI